MEAIETFEHNGKTVQILPDTYPIDPRSDFDHAGTMVCWHRNYILGDGQPSADPSEFLTELAGDEGEAANAWAERVYDRMDRDEYSDREWATACREIEDKVRDRVMRAVEKRHVILPLYLYDHSGITMSCSPFSCRWDSGQVGWIYMDRATILKEFGGKRLTRKRREQAEKLLRSEVAEYDQYLTGDVWGYVIEDTNGDEVDSCWGFYGIDHARDQAREAAE